MNSPTDFLLPQCRFDRGCDLGAEQLDRALLVSVPSIAELLIPDRS
jgi:hypothetical protein